MSRAGDDDEAEHLDGSQSQPDSHDSFPSFLGDSTGYHSDHDDSSSTNYHPHRQSENHPISETLSFLPEDLKGFAQRQSAQSMGGRLISTVAEYLESKDAVIAEMAQYLDEADRVTHWQSKCVTLQEQNDKLKLQLTKLTSRYESACKTQTTLATFGRPVGMSNSQFADGEESQPATLSVHDVFSDIESLLELFDQKIQIQSPLVNTNDLYLLQAFLRTLQEQKREEQRKIDDDLKIVARDIDRVERMIGSSQPRRSSASSSSSNPFGGRPKRTATGPDDNRFEEDDDDAADDHERPSPSQIKRLRPHFAHLSQTYFESKGGSSSSGRVPDDGDFTTILGELSSAIRDLDVKATFKYGASPARQAHSDSKISSFVSCIRCRRDEFISIAGHAGEIQLFTYDSLLASPEDELTPVYSLQTEDKVHSTCWDPFRVPYLIAVGHRGSVNVWDLTTTSIETALQEHTGPIFSVDISEASRGLFATGSQDKTVRVWHTSQPTSTLSLNLPGEVRGVAFNPVLENQLFAACDDSKLYGYDIRVPEKPQFALSHNYPLTNLQFISRTEIATQTVGSTLMLWNFETKKSKAYRGHHQRFHSTGFAAKPSWLVTGSEDNSLSIYSVNSESPFFQHSFNTGIDEEDQGARVTACCWRGESDVLIAGNSKGYIKLLGLTRKHS